MPDDVAREGAARADAPAYRQEEPLREGLHEPGARSKVEEAEDNFGVGLFS
jgi:hypothetical protein